jgi:uncharacterized membrane protein (UPF0127 family)
VRPALLRFALPFGVLGLALLALAAAGCRREAPPADEAAEARPSIPFRLDGTLRFLRADGTPITGIAIEIAETDSARTRGLMERDSIPAQVGMLFIMPRTEVHTFWMANTPRSLDIIYVGEDSRIVSVAKYTRPFSTGPVTAEGPAKYVVEVAAGFADRYGLVPGDLISWARNGSETPAYGGGLPGAAPAPPDSADAPDTAAAP